LNIEQYVESSEGLRVVDMGNSKFKIVMEREGSGLWHIEVDSGIVPVALRGRFTGHRQAFIAIKNYVDQAPNRQINYKKPKVTED